jgi:hypothetical protein
MSFKFKIDSTTSADMELPPPLETLRLPKITAPSVVKSYMFGGHDGLCDTAFSISTEIDTRSGDTTDIHSSVGRQQHCTHVISLPLYITAPYSARARIVSESNWEFQENLGLTDPNLAHSRLAFVNQITNDGGAPPRKDGKMLGTLTSSTGRSFWTSCEYQFQPAIPTIIRVHTSSGTGITSAGRVVARKNQPYRHGSAADGCSNSDGGDDGSRVLCELRIPGYVDVYDLSVLYDEHLGRLCLLYQEHENSSEGDDRSWTLRARVWDIDIESEES